MYPYTLTINQPQVDFIPCDISIPHILNTLELLGNQCLHGSAAVWTSQVPDPFFTSVGTIHILILKDMFYGNNGLYTRAYDKNRKVV